MLQYTQTEIQAAITELRSTVAFYRKRSLTSLCPKERERAAKDAAATQTRLEELCALFLGGA